MCIAGTGVSVGFSMADEVKDKQKQVSNSAALPISPLLQRADFDEPDGFSFSSALKL